MSASVQILLSLYKPNIDFLRKQLISLDRQTWDNLEVLILDDTGLINLELQEEVDSCLEKVKYRWLEPNGFNLGFVKAFERLITESTAEYLVFCDQDDEWDREKVQVLVSELQKTGNKVAVSDKRIIDETGSIKMESARHCDPHYYNQWNTGDDITKRNLVITFSEGMTMLADGDFCRSVMPIPAGSAHDQWILACAGINRQVSYVDKPLVSYRRHSENVSGILKGISSKSDYYRERVIPFYKTATEFIQRYPEYDGNQELHSFAVARKNGDVLTMLKLRSMAPEVVLFETAMRFCPDFLFRALLAAARRIG